MTTSLDFHHVGVACNSIERELKIYQQLGYTYERGFTDSIQGVRGAFICLGGMRLELLENLPGSSTLNVWISREIKLYHIGYYVHSVSGGLKWMKENRVLVTSKPQPAIAFNGRSIVFGMTRNGDLIELISKTD